ncbi:MAG: sodium-dependent transporter, partial [Cetobacterium sp.]
MSEKREKFSNKIGFILSCVGAAIGLGNIWLFSWKLGTYGGGAFLIPY